MFDFGVPGKWYMQVFIPVSHCKDTHNFDKTNNFFKKVKKKGDQTPGLLYPKLTELLYYYKRFCQPSTKGDNTVAVVPANTLHSFIINRIAQVRQIWPKSIYITIPFRRRSGVFRPGNMYFGYIP